MRVDALPNTLAVLRQSLLAHARSPRAQTRAAEGSAGFLHDVTRSSPSQKSSCTLILNRRASRITVGVLSRIETWRSGGVRLLRRPFSQDDEEVVQVAHDEYGPPGPKLTGVPPVDTTVPPALLNLSTAESMLRTMNMSRVAPGS